MSLEICRICGSKENLKHVFREGTDELLDKIRLCANIHIDAVDSLPKFVCNACEHGLDFSYRLRKRGEETEKMLRQELLGPTKREHSTSVEDDEKGDAVNGGIDEANEELWIKEEHNEHFDEESIDHVKEETSPMKQSCDETEDWLTMPDEDISDTDEIIVNGSVGHIKVEPMIDQGESCSSMIEELDQTDSQNLTSKAPAVNQCLTCGEIFKKRNKEYSDHIRAHGNKRFHCSTCDRWFKVQKHFKRHLQIHTRRETVPCPICNKQYTTTEGVHNHCKYKHSLEKTFPCSECGSASRTKSALKRHIATVHSSDKIFECGVCHLKFRTEILRDRHHKKAHLPESERPKWTNSRRKRIPCDVCQKICLGRMAHLEHMSVHTGEKLYKCTLCDQTYQTNAGLKCHMIKHSNLRSYECKHCSKTFWRRSHLNVHMSVHESTRQYVCEICNRAFKFKMSLSQHLKKHSVKPYTCSRCPQGFIYQNQLTQHLRSHNNTTNDRADVQKKREATVSEQQSDMQTSSYVYQITEITPDNVEIKQELVEIKEEM